MLQHIQIYGRYKSLILIEFFDVRQTGQTGSVQKLQEKQNIITENSRRLYL